MDFLAQVRNKARYGYYWLTGLWHVLGLIKQSNFDFAEFDKKSQQFASQVKSRTEIKDLDKNSCL